MSIEQVLADYAVNGRFARFDSIPDEDIIKLVQGGDSEAL
jgi:hypothetical protein